MDTLFGRKVGMTQVFLDDGTAVPVTVIQAGPCPVVQVKTRDHEGYDAVQLGFGEMPKRLLNLPTKGHFGKVKMEPRKYLREVRVESTDGIEVGNEFRVSLFSVGEKVDVTGISKGLGFQGVVRRYHFGGGSKTHGQSDRVRAPGSIGSSSYPSRVFKGLRMAGRMGGDSVTLKNLVVVKIDPDNDLICVRGAVPGKRLSFVRIRKSR